MYFSRHVLGIIVVRRWKYINTLYSKIQRVGRQPEYKAQCQDLSEEFYCVCVKHLIGDELALTYSG